MDLVIEGLKPGQIAERLNLTLSYVSTIIHAPQFDHQLAIRRERIEERIDSDVVDRIQESTEILRKNAVAAANRIAAQVDSESDAIAFRASTDILDRVGQQKRSGVEVTQTTVNIDVKAAMLIKETLDMDKIAS
jgi:hypothetical protein